MYFHIFIFYLALSLLFHLDIIRLLIIWIYSIFRCMSLLLGVMHVTYSFWLYYQFLLLLPIFLLFLALYVLCNSPCLEEYQGKCKAPNLCHLRSQPPQCYPLVGFPQDRRSPLQSKRMSFFRTILWTHFFQVRGGKKHNRHLCLNLKNSDFKSLLKSPLVT